MNSVEDLDVFKLAHQLALKTYSATKAFQRKNYSAWEIKRAGRPLVATHFDVSRILETWKFPFLLVFGI
jgi:hypothetical protein